MICWEFIFFVLIVLIVCYLNHEFSYQPSSWFLKVAFLFTRFRLTAFPGEPSKA